MQSFYDASETDLRMYAGFYDATETNLIVYAEVL